MDYKIRFCCPTDQIPLGPELFCTAWGNRHYQTLDGFPYDFLGSCTYNYLSTTGSASQTNLHPFGVWIQNDHPFANIGVFSMRKVHLRFSGQLITLDHGRHVKVNGKIIDLGTDYEDPFYGYQVHDNGMFLEFTSVFGLKVMFDGNLYLRVGISVDYQENVKGLCGNFNSDVFDDFRPFTNDIEFAHSHGVYAKCEKPEPAPVCDGLISTYSVQMCFNMIGASCFIGCFDSGFSTPFVATCQKDYCALKGSQFALDATLKDMHMHCSVIGANPCDDPSSAWDEVLCQPDKVLNRCGPACPATCENPEPEECGPCIAACQCTEGLVLNTDSNTCIPKEACECTPDTTFRTEGCDYICLCSSVGVASCFPFPCFINEECINRTCQPRETCPIPSGSFMTDCASPCPATCLDPYPDPCLEECQPGCECQDSEVVESDFFCTSMEFCFRCSDRKYQDGVMYYNYDCTSVCWCSNGVQNCQSTFCDTTTAICSNGQCIPENGYCGEIIGSFYSDCANPCPPTCSNLNPTGPECTQPCIEGCQCFPGFVLQEDINQCVVPEACGCYDEVNDFYLQFGQYLRTCTRVCVCLPGGIQCFDGLTCEPFFGTCDGNECIPYPPECAHIPNSIYLECGPSCPETCIPTNETICSDVCVEGCHCPPNLILNEAINACVVRDGGCEGCQNEAGEPIMESFGFFQENCTELCFCRAGTIVCFDFTCDSTCVDEVCILPPSPASGSAGIPVADPIQLIADRKEIGSADFQRLIAKLLGG
uniref:IgGFc-binding protein-like n=1 Tax=Phallusia mammillata TaxID=59560 RepID=A0A6F9DC15_9ASCI|nr:IgGFc-binding protein-like [Phallusia mammillata]